MGRAGRATRYGGNNVTKRLFRCILCLPECQSDRIGCALRVDNAAIDNSAGARGRVTDDTVSGNSGQTALNGHAFRRFELQNKTGNLGLAKIQQRRKALILGLPEIVSHDAVLRKGIHHVSMSFKNTTLSVVTRRRGHNNAI